MYDELVLTDLAGWRGAEVDLLPWRGVCRHGILEP
jgi:hypothetical protein